MTDTTVTPNGAPVKKARKTFAQQLAETAAKKAKLDRSLAVRLAKTDKDSNPELAKAATALDTLVRAQKLLGKFRDSTGYAEMTLDECVAGLSKEMASAMPGLMAKIADASE